MSSGTTTLSPRARLKEIGGFELLSRIGEGAMGTVFKARQKSLDRIVAVKILPPSTAANREFIARFQREARATGKLSHPNIVGAIDVGQDAPSGMWYFAMEYIDGPSLKQVLDEQEVFEERRALEIVLCVARALGCIEREGLVHRDVKPHNILLTSKGVPKLADLGLAHEIDGGGLSETGRALGTPCYMSPEQVRGEIDRLDIRTDLYSLGATLFHLVTGRPPFVGKNGAEIMTKQLYEPVPQASRYNRKVSLECSRIIHSLMQKEKERRMRSPAVLIEALERILSRTRAPGSAVTKAASSSVHRRVAVADGTTTARPVRAKAEERRRPRSARTNHAGLLLALAVLGGGSFVWWSSQQPPTVRPPVRAAGSGASAAPTSPRTATETQTLPVDPLAAQWKKAQLYAQKYPDDHAEIVRRYALVLKAAQGTLLEKEVSIACKGAEARMQAALDAVWPAIEERVTAAANEGDFDRALEVLDSLTDERRRLLRERIDKRAEALCREAEQRINSTLAKVEEALMLGDAALARSESEKLAQVRFAPLKASLDRIRERVEKEGVRLEAEALARRFGARLALFDQALLETEDGEAAAKVATEAQGTAEFERFGAQVAAMSELVAAWKQVFRRESLALEKLRGGALKVGSEQGTIEKVEDRVVHVRVGLEGGRILVMRKVPVAQLPDDIRLQVLKTVPFRTPAEKVAGALRLLVRGREHFESARALLEEATQFPLTPHYLDLIRSRQSGNNGTLAKPMR